MQHGLTVDQDRLLERHHLGLAKLALVLAAKTGAQSTDIMFVIADRRGRLGSALGALLPVASIGAVVLPGRAAELGAWVEQLALHGPVWDCAGGGFGIAVIVIDEHDKMALCVFGLER
ncbi:MAG TPA: hypothetical protein VGC79_25675 [Polyangiaceae bacterium]